LPTSSCAGGGGGLSGGGGGCCWGSSNSSSSSSSNNNGDRNIFGGAPFLSAESARLFRITSGLEATNDVMDNASEGGSNKGSPNNNNGGSSGGKQSSTTGNTRLLGGEYLAEQVGHFTNANGNSASHRPLEEVG
jgi:hypothetical protein